MTVVLCAGRPTTPAWLSGRHVGRPAGLTVWTTALPGSRLVCAAADEGVTLLPPPCADRTPSRRRAIAIWRAVLAHGDPRAVRVLVLPDASLDEILIARALGATIGRVETATTPDVTRCTGGAAGIVRARRPDDRAGLPAEDNLACGMGDAGRRAGLHNSYVRRGASAAPRTARRSSGGRRSALAAGIQRRGARRADKLAALGLRLRGSWGGRRAEGAVDANGSCAEQGTGASPRSA
jgi:hypothetical protein